MLLKKNTIKAKLRISEINFKLSQSVLGSNHGVKKD